MVNKLFRGDYVACPAGIVRLHGAQAAFANALFRLQCRRGSFPFLPELGSRLWQLGQVRQSERTACARQYCIEALQGSGVTPVNVSVTQEGNALAVEVTLQHGEQTVTVEVSV